MYLAFSAKYLVALVAALRALSRATQSKAVSAYIQILSLLPDSKENPYFRKFLSSPSAVGLPNLVTSNFVQGIDWPGPGHFSALLIHLLFWCDISMGDDERASIDKATCDTLATGIRDLHSQPDITSLPELGRVELERLAGILNAIEQMPGGHYLKSTQEYLQEQVHGQDECIVCMDDAEMLCSQCKSVRYCSKECQMKAWKGGHKRRCWTMVE